MSKKPGPAWTKPPSLTTRATRAEVAVAGGLHLGDQVEAAEPRGGLAALQIDVLADHAADAAGGVDRDLAGDVDQARRRARTGT